MADSLAFPSGRPTSVPKIGPINGGAAIILGAPPAPSVASDSVKSAVEFSAGTPRRVSSMFRGARWSGGDCERAESNKMHQPEPLSDIFLRINGCNHQSLHHDDDLHRPQLQQQQHHHHHHEHHQNHHCHNHSQQQHKYNHLPSARPLAMPTTKTTTTTTTTTTTKAATPTTRTNNRATRRSHRPLIGHLNLEELSFRKAPLSSRWCSFLLALIYHFVIISLILHQLPASKQALASLAPLAGLQVYSRPQATSAQQHHHLHLNQRQQQQQQQQHSVNHKDISKRDEQLSELHYTSRSRPFGSFINEQEEEEADSLNSGEQRDNRKIRAGSIRSLESGARRNRHLAADLDGGETNTSRSLSSSSIHKRRPQTGAIDCQKLAILWVFLQTSYPALASHLFQWATRLDGKQSDEQFLWAKSSGSARSIGRLLEDAERLVEAQGSGKQRTHSAPVAGGESRQQPWLQRVGANPAYARLVQQFLSSRQAKALKHTATTTTTGPPSLNGEQSDAENLERTRTGSDAMANGERMVAAASSQQQQHYGRMIHYPHEIGNTDSSEGIARTLDKLRLLDQHARQQQASATAELSDIETNRIPSQPQDVDSQHRPAPSARKAGPDSVDSARSNFVYGKVLLRPQHPNDFSSDRHNQRSDPLGALRELATEQQRQLVDADGLLVASTRSLDGRPWVTHSRSSSSKEHYGRIINSPPSSERASTRASDNTDSSRNQQQQQQQQPRGDNPSRLMVEDGGERGRSSGSTFDVGFSSAASSESSADELSSQQRVQQVALTGEQGEDEEFEGVFHSGPLREVEVRQLRSLDHQQQRRKSDPQLVELVTTIKPPEVKAID